MTGYAYGFRNVISSKIKFSNIISVEIDGSLKTENLILKEKLYYYIFKAPKKI
jgi:hypothetical protein